MRPFWKRRHPITRVIMLTLVIPPALFVGFFIAPIVQQFREDWPSLGSGLREEYRYAWRTPRTKR